MEPDFDSVMEPEEAGLDPKLSNRSSPSGDEFLFNVLNDMRITKEDSILDIGCGKGSAISVMLGFPFKWVSGVEISDKIVRIAKDNLRKTKAMIYHYDATKFPHYHEYNYFYMYNPFCCDTMADVIHEINRWKGVMKKRFIIYNNPVCHITIHNYGWSKIKEFPDKWGNRIFVYKENK